MKKRNLFKKISIIVGIIILLLISIPAKGDREPPVSFTGKGDKITESFKLDMYEFGITWETEYESEDRAFFAFFIYPEGETEMYIDSKKQSGGALEPYEQREAFYAIPGSYYLKVLAFNITNWEITVTVYPETSKGIIESERPKGLPSLLKNWQIAVETRDIDLCKKLGEGSDVPSYQIHKYKISCIALSYKGLAIDKDDPTFCEKSNDECYLTLAKKRNDVSLCDEIRETLYAEEYCFKALGHTPDPSLRADLVIKKVDVVPSLRKEGEFSFVVQKGKPLPTGVPLNFEIYVGNEGKREAKGVGLELIDVTPGQARFYNWAFHHYGKIESILPGEVKMGTISVPPGAELPGPPGWKPTLTDEYHFTLSIDNDKKILEINEENNEASVKIKLAEGISLLTIVSIIIGLIIAGGILYLLIKSRKKVSAKKNLY